MVLLASGKGCVEAWGTCVPPARCLRDELHPACLQGVQATARAVCAACCAISALCCVEQGRQEEIFDTNGGYGVASVCAVCQEQAAVRGLGVLLPQCADLLCTAVTQQPAFVAGDNSSSVSQISRCSMVGCW